MKRGSLVSFFASNNRKQLFSAGTEWVSSPHWEANVGVARKNLWSSFWLASLRHSLASAFLWVAVMQNASQSRAHSIGAAFKWPPVLLEVLSMESHVSAGRIDELSKRYGMSTFAAPQLLINGILIRLWAFVKYRLIALEKKILVSEHNETITHHNMALQKQNQLVR